MQLKGQKIIVTGAAQGIGKGLVEAFVKEGAIVAGMDFNGELGLQSCEQANGIGPGKASFYQCDVASKESVDAAFDAAVADLGGLDGMVNCVGVYRDGYLCESIDDDAQKWMFDINYFGTVHTNQAAFRYMKDNENGGRILNFGAGAGVSAKCVAINPVHYGTSKAAVHQWVKYAAFEWGEYGICVNAITPLAASEMFWAAIDTPEKQAWLDERINLTIDRKYYGDIEHDLAPYCVFLVSEGARYVTGQILNCDGGMIESR